MVAGEASGDLLGSLLLRGMRQRWPDLVAGGIGGPRMAAEGFDCWWPHERLSFFGYAEVLARLPELVQLRRDLRSRVVRDAPAAFVGIDAPDFNLGLEERLRGRGIRTIHFVCPSIPSCCIEPYGHSHPQNSPRPHTSTVAIVNHQKMNSIGSERNSSHRHSKKIAWNQVSTWVMLGCASAQAPTKPTLAAQIAYFGPSTQRMSLRVARRTSRSRCEYSPAVVASSSTKSAISTGRPVHARSQSGSGRTTVGRPPSR